MPAAPTGNTIALVEDNEHLRKWLLTLLTRRGYEVTAYPNGAEALVGIVDAGQPDLVISDFQMPQMDGVSLCKALRARYAKTQLPFILISVMDGEDEIVAGLEAGANDYLVKPFSSQLVLAKIGLLLKERESAPPTDALPPLYESPLEFPFRFGRYQLLGQLGEGSYGVVYKAQRVSDEQMVALKLIDPRINAERDTLARYLREVATLSSIDAPHVVQFIDAGFERQRYYLAMEHLPGLSTWHAMKAKGPFQVSDILLLGEQMCEALAAINEKDLVHRDLKPANIVVAPDGGFTLIDFGLAKDRTESALTQSDEFLGTAEYIAPEVITGASREHIGSDVYALGITLWELLVGDPPFTADSTYDILLRVSACEPAEPVRAHRPDVPQALSDLIAWMMHPLVEKRLCDPALAQAEFRKLRL